MRFSALVLAALASPIALAQGSQADYDRAASFNSRFGRLAPRAWLSPVWADGGLFYLKPMPGGGSRLMKAGPGQPAEALNHDAFLAALRAQKVEPFQGSSLPLERFEIEDGSIFFITAAAQNVGQFRMSDSRLTWQPITESRRFRLPNLGRPQRSTNGGRASSIRLVNPTQVELKVFWLNADGGEAEYGTIAPGGSWSSNTYVGHVWQLRSAEGVSYGVFRSEGAVDFGVAERAGAAAASPRPAPQRRGQPGLSPDGNRQVVLQNGRIRLLGEGGEDVDFGPSDGVVLPPFWSPDSERFVLRQRTPGGDRQVTIVESSPRDQLQPKTRIFDYLKPGDPVPIDLPRLFDAAAAKEIPVQPGPFTNSFRNDNWRWSADSKTFWFRHVQRGHQAVRIMAINGQTGASTPIINEEPETFVDYAQKHYLEHLDETGEIIWMSERSGWNHIYLIDSATGRVKRPITQGDWVVRRVVSLDRERREMILEVGGIQPGEDPYHAHFVRASLDGKPLVRLTQSDGDHTIEFSPDGKWIIARHSRMDSAPVTELRDAQTGRLAAELDRGSLDALNGAGWQTPERFAAPGRDGKTMIYGVIIRPSNFDPAKRYPVIENIYAGPHAAHVPKSFSVGGGMNSLAELGFIVVQIDGMGTSERSKAFHDVAWRNIADAGFPDRIAWMRAAAETRPWMDLDRVGIYGTSAGGQNSLGAMLQYGDFYDAAVSDCGCHDNRMDKIWWNELWMGEVGPHYEAQSNVTMAPNLQGALLLMVGEVDTNVDPASTMQVVDALIRADKDFDLIVAPNVGHGVLGTAYGRRRMYDFFVEKLHGVKPRWSAAG
jgi:dipeptidyl-peptidase-4